MFRKDAIGSFDLPVESPTEVCVIVCASEIQESITELPGIKVVELCATSLLKYWQEVEETRVLESHVSLLHLLHFSFFVVRWRPDLGTGGGALTGNHIS